MKNLAIIFKNERLKKNISIEKVATTLKIKKEYLLLLENPEMAEKIELESVYIRGYSKLYANFLGINLEMIQNQENNKAPLVCYQTFSEEENPSKIFTSIACLMIFIVIHILSNNFSTEHKYFASDYNFLDTPRSDVMDFDHEHQSKIMIFAKHPTNIVIFSKDGQMVHKGKLNSGEIYSPPEKQDIIAIVDSRDHVRIIHEESLENNKIELLSNPIK